ncbi:MAG: sulfurtransferase TusA family protein [Prevotellaceae bacterium]|jgi:TusA-related sulfurtransferase|nr:sulfurtransferase TusA family protein [Prevotellaceae bacterium]
MKTIDTRGNMPYSQLIPAIKAIDGASAGDKLEIIMTSEDAFNDLKEYLAEQHIGFREIYGSDVMTLQFTVC